MPNVAIVIDRSPSAVWSVFSIPAKWKSWWGELKAVEPGWESGAKMIWEAGPPATVVSDRAEKSVDVQSPWMEHSFRFRGRGGRTVVEIEFKPRGGAAFTDGGAAEHRNLATSLAKLKTLVENETSIETESGERKLWQFWK